MSTVQVLLIEIGVILLLSRLLGQLMSLIHQPQVVGEMIAGIMLGPSVLGLINHGAWMNALFPKSMMGNLEALSQLGVMIFMFLVGLELDPKLLRGQGKAALVTGTIGIVIPFAGGVLLGLGLIRFAESVTGQVASPLVLCMFMGAAMSITAFPVLARILTERNLHKTRSGTLALACAAMDDVLGWCILAFVLAVAQTMGFGHSSGGHSAAIGAAGRTVLLAIAYAAVMIFLVRRILSRLQAHFETRGFLTQSAMAIVFLLLIASSLATDAIGIHQLFGAFLLGAVMPKDARFVKHLAEKVEDFTVLFLLPLFFAYTGLRTELGLLGSAQLWMLSALIILVAVAGKFGGVTLAARFYGMPWRQSALLGVLMNTRGLMELIVLNIGLSIGVLSRPLFAMMVMMALATTFMTTPLMRLLYSPKRQREELDDAAREEAERVVGMHVFVPVSLESSAPSLVRLGGLLMAGDPGRLYAVHLDRPEELSRGAGNTDSEADRVLDVARRAARANGIPVHTISYVSRDIASEIINAARRYQASWTVLGWHKSPVFGDINSGVVGRVLSRAPSNVAILVDKGLGAVRRVLIPSIGGAADRGALNAAERLGRVGSVTIEILQLIGEEQPDAAIQRSALDALIEQMMPESLSRGVVHVRAIQSKTPVDAIVEESARHDLIILGLHEDWDRPGGAAFAFGESAAQGAQCSVLIAHANPKAPILQPKATVPEFPTAPAPA